MHNSKSTTVLIKNNALDKSTALEATAIFIEKEQTKNDGISSYSFNIHVGVGVRGQYYRFGAPIGELSE